MLNITSTSTPPKSIETETCIANYTIDRCYNQPMHRYKPTNSDRFVLNPPLEPHSQQTLAMDKP
jgi:hypothetical protein